MADYKGQVEFDETKIPVFEADNDDFTLTLYNLNYGHDYVINVNDTQGDTRNGAQGGTQDRSQKQIFDIAANPSAGSFWCFPSIPQYA